MVDRRRALTESKIRNIVKEEIEDHSRVFQFLYRISQITKPGVVKSKFSSIKEYLNSISDKEFYQIAFSRFFVDEWEDDINELEYKTYLFDMYRQHGPKYFLNSLELQEYDGVQDVEDWPEFKLNADGEKLFYAEMVEEGKWAVENTILRYADKKYPMTIHIEREIILPISMNNLYYDLQSQYADDFGDYWAFEGCHSYAMDGAKMRKDDVAVINGRIAIDNIDWIKVEMISGLGENEVIVKDIYNEQIMLESIVFNGKEIPFKPTRLVNW